VTARAASPVAGAPINLRNLARAALAFAVTAAAILPGNLWTLDVADVTAGGL